MLHIYFIIIWQYTNKSTFLNCFVWSDVDIIIFPNSSTSTWMGFKIALQSAMENHTSPSYDNRMNIKMSNVELQLIMFNE